MATVAQQPLTEPSVDAGKRLLKIHSMGDHDAQTISTPSILGSVEFFHMWILKTNVAVSSHLVNLTLEEVSVEFHSTIFTLGITSKLFCTRLIKWFGVAVRGGMATVIVFLHESFQFIGSRDAPIVPIEFLNLADEVFGEFHFEVRVLVDAHVVHIDWHSHFLPVAQCFQSMKRELFIKDNHNVKMKTVIEYKNSLFNKRNAHLEKCAFLCA